MINFICEILLFKPTNLGDVTVAFECLYEDPKLTLEDLQKLAGSMRIARLEEQLPVVLAFEFITS